MKEGPDARYRPTLRGVVGTFVVIGLIQVFDLVTHDDVLTAVVTFVVCGSYIAWFIWKNRYR